jgi:hypothetical protein
MKQRVLILFLLIISLSTCIDPFDLELEDYESLLVVEGMITDEPASNTIKLSRTFKHADGSPVMVSHAEVSVQDENGVITLFQENEPGIYLSDPEEFTGRVGGTYSLQIRTEDGLEYISGACTMTAVPGIDSLYYEPDSEFYENGTIEEAGLRVYLDTDNRDETCPYMRWEFEEIWEFRVPYPLLVEDLGYKEYKTKHVENDICWRYEQSIQILIYSSEEESSELIGRKPIQFINPGRSDRLLRQYSIQVRQYSLSLEEFSFWNKLKEITESEGDIFEKQPFPIEGNIHCINREDVDVLGYFQVSAVNSQRIYITRSEANALDLPAYEYPCERLIYRNRQLTEKLYNSLLSDGYVLFWVLEDDFGNPVNFQYTSLKCADCTLTGKPEQPDFWVDME